MVLNPLDRVVRDVEDLKRQLAGRSQLNHSSLENTAIPVYDGDGTERLRIGAQDDGTHSVKYVQGPPPPRPTAPIVSVDGPVVRVRWDGMLLGGHIPEDFSRIDVHFALSTDDLEADEAVRGNLATSAGNETVLAATSTGTYRVGLVAMSQSRARSEMSETVDVDVTLVDIEGALDAVVENARGGSNHYRPVPPPGTDHDPDRDLWFDTSVDAEGLVSYSPHRWDADLLEWVSVADQRTAALQDALGDLEGTVEQRFTDADTAIDGLRDSLANLDETTLPALRQDLDAAEGRLGEAEGQITDAFGQIEAVPGQIATARQEAIDAAQQELNAVEGTLQSAIDAKRDITWSTSSPPAVYDGPVGSTWFKMSGNGSGAQVESQWRWNGNVWVSTILSAAVIAKIDIGEGTYGSLDGIRLKAGSVQAASIAVGDFSNFALIDPVQDINVPGRTVTDGDYTRIAPGSSEVLLFNVRTNSVPFQAGDSLRVSFVAKADDYIRAQFRVWAYPQEASGSPSGQRQIAGGYFELQAGDEARREAVIDIPDDFGDGVVYRSWVIGLAPHSTSSHMSNLGVREAGVYRQTGATLIQDGAILTEKLAADVLEVGNLKAGAGEIAELVSRKIAAATGQFLELDVGQLTVTQQSRLTDVVAEQIAADTARFMELEVGKLVASEGILDEAVIKQLFAEVVVSQMSFADSFIGGNAILEGSITAESGIIGSLDLGVAIVGKLHGQYIEAGSIDTEQLAFGAATGDVLSVDALNFKTAVGLDIRGSSFRAGDAVEITEDFGIRQFGPDGALNVSLPSDGSEAEFRGDLSARTLTATGRMSIQGPGAIASGGVLELESGVVPPVNPPGVSTYIERTTFPTLADNESPWGLAWAGGSWWRAINVTGTAEGDRIERISPTGELISSFPTEEGDPRGLTAIGDELFLLASRRLQGGENRTVFVYDLAGNLKREWDYPNYGTGTYQPGIGTDGTNILIAQSWATGALTWRRFNKTTGELMAQVDSDRVFRSDIMSIYQGPADYGTERVVISWGNSIGTNEVYTTSGVYQPLHGWLANNRQQVRGTAWVNEQFHHLMVEGNLVTQSTVAYPNGEPSVDTDDWWAALTWSDGASETTIGPARRFTFMRRTDLRLSFGTPPEGAPVARVYLARKTTEPSRADFHLVEEVPTGAGQATIILPTGWAQAETPPAANSFPNSTPGIIRSTLGQFEVDGTGAGRWGPLTFHADGTMSSSAVPDWIPVTTFRTGFGPQTWGFVPAYRIWPDGKVEWRGVVAGNITGTSKPFTVPAEAMPPYPVSMPAATNATGGINAITRIEFGQLDDPGALTVYRGEADRTWVSLDGTSYYLT